MVWGWVLFVVGLGYEGVKELVVVWWWCFGEIYWGVWRREWLGVVEFGVVLGGGVVNWVVGLVCVELGDMEGGVVFGCF